MISPNPSVPAPRPDLAAVMTEFDLEATMAGFVGLRIFVPRDVALQSGNIGRIKISSLLKQYQTRRASGAAYNETGFEFEDFAYATADHGQTIPIDDRLRHIYLNSFDAEVEGTKMVRHAVMQAHEQRVVAMATDTGVYTNTPAGAFWSNKASADPVAEVIAAKLRVRAQSGQMPNAVVLDVETFTNAIESESIIDRLKSSGFDDPKKINEQSLAQLFKVDQVIVSGAQQNTANPNVNNASGSPSGLSLKTLWPRNVVAVGRVATTQNLQEVCVGRTFHWAADGSQMGGLIETWEDPVTRSTRVRCRMETAEQRYFDSCWTLITGTAAAA